MIRPLTVAIVFLASQLCCGPTIAQEAAPKAEVKPPMKVGTHQPLLDVTTLQGGLHPTWAELSGKVVVIDFWATWCGPCIASFPKLNALKSAMAGKPVEFLSVSYETRGQVEPVLRKYALKTTVSLDNDFRTFKAFNAWGIPSVFIFDKRGNLTAVVYPEDATPALLETVLNGGIPNVEQEKAWDDPAGAEASFRAMREKAVEAEKH